VQNKGEEKEAKEDGCKRWEHRVVFTSRGHKAGKMKNQKTRGEGGEKLKYSSVDVGGVAVGRKQTDII